MNREQTLLPCHTIDPSGSPRATVIWLHGLGANGHDFAPLVPELGLDDLGVRWVLPNAPAIPVTVNGGFVMPAWYDIEAVEGAPRDEVGVRRSVSQVRTLLERELALGHVPAERVVLAGFSQGGAIAAHLGVSFEQRLAGLVLLSTYIVCEDIFTPGEANRGLPIFQAHGELDPMVAIERGEAARDRLTALGHPVEWHPYPMLHQVSQDEVRDLSAWLRARLAV